MGRWRPPGEKATALITREGHARLKAELDEPALVGRRLDLAQARIDVLPDGLLDLRVVPRLPPEIHQHVEDDEQRGDDGKGGARQRAVQRQQEHAGRSVGLDRWTRAWHKSGPWAAGDLLPKKRPR